MICKGIDRLIEYFGSDFGKLIGNELVELVEYEVDEIFTEYNDINIELTFIAKEAKRRVVKIT